MAHITPTYTAQRHERARPTPYQRQDGRRPSAQEQKVNQTFNRTRDDANYLKNCNRRISAALKKNDLSTAQSILQEIARKSRPDAYTYNPFIKYYIEKQGNVDGTLAQMSEMGVARNVVTYNMLINGCVKRGDIQQAKELLCEMQVRAIRPDDQTFNSLINVCVKKGDIAQAEAFFLLMREDGVDPDVQTFTSLINVCVKAGNIAEANEFFRQMQDAGVHPDVHTFNALIDLYIATDQYEAAKYVFRYAFPCPREYQTEFDLHDLSYGAAKTVVLLFLERPETELTLITGIGYRSSHDLFEMKKQVSEFASEQKLTIAEDPKNPGRIKLIKE